MLTFDPTKYGAVEVEGESSSLGEVSISEKETGFDPTKYGAVPVAAPQDVRETISAEEVVTQPRPERTFLQALGSSIPSAPASGARLLGTVFSALTSPLQTLESVVALGSGAIQKLIPGRQKHEETFDVVADYYTKRFGSWEGFKEAIAEDPVGVLADFSALTGVGGLGLRAASLGAKTARLGTTATRLGTAATRAARVSRATDPLLGALKGAKAIKKGAGFIAVEGLGITTGVGGGSIRAALKSPTEAYRNALRGKTSEATLLGTARDAVSGMKEARGVAYKKDLVGIKKATVQLKNLFGDIKTNMYGRFEGYGIKRNKKGELDFSGSKIADKAEQTRVKDIATTVDEWTDFSPVGVDMLKQRLGDFYSPSSKARAFVTTLKKDVTKLLDDNVPGYKDMTASYTEATELITDIERAFGGSKSSKDAAIRKLTSALRQNTEFRKNLIMELEKASGQDIQSVIAGISMQQATPRGLIRPLIGATGAVGGGLLNPAFWAGLATASPRLVGELINVLGRGRQAGRAVGRAGGRTILDVLGQRGTLATQVTRAPREERERIRREEIAKRRGRFSGRRF